jgi:hypothetical protein
VVRYIFNEDEPLPVIGAKKTNPQIVGEALQEIADKSGGKLTPKAVVDSAKARSHPLHKHFEWDDAAAAGAYRLDQARALIRLVRVEDDNYTEPPRAFLSVHADKETCYYSLQDVRESESLQSALMKAAKRDLESFKRRYRSLEEICSDVNEAIRKIDSRIARETRTSV